MNFKQLTLDSFDTGMIFNKHTDSQKCRFQHLKYCMSLAHQPGHILEFGVYQGATINLISEYFIDDTIYGFDSFEGLPEDWHLSETHKKFRKGTFAVDSLPNVNNNVRLIKGWFDVSLPKFISSTHIKTIKLLHIDCDL